MAAEGIHARPATALIRLVKKYKSIVSLRKGESTIQLNSMLNILTLGAKGGDTVTVLVDGADEAEAAAAIDNFFTEELKTL
ncbi:HPr family phosphocarrier protein [Chryseolinea sp. Jin1]|uniref:Phosphocarrier protein HPr n=2 Tax=Chryseolinea lacunae TaxID=2801331 RepID=A0ABS1KK67_9BACT|nr:HPr family phosphocarrier protein [Chryseolinea lacunae]